MTEEQKRERCRWAVLEHLYERAAVTSTLTQIHNQLGRQGYDHTDLRVALGYWADLKPDACVDITKNRHGSTEYFQITSAGQIAWEQRD